MTTENGPNPTQICTWLPKRSGWAANPPVDSKDASAGEWLYCLKATEPGDRQAVWSGVHGNGIIGVVDFNGEVRPRSSSGRLYEGWGRITALPQPVSVERAQRHPALARCFSTSIQSVQAIDEEIGQAIAECSGGLPVAATFDEAADWSQDGGRWSGERLAPELITETLVRDKKRIAKRVGLIAPVNPTGTRKRLANGRIPDLWCEAGVVGEVKNQVTAAWGPEQLEGYINQCDEEWPERAPWSGVLVQGVPEMAPNAWARLEDGRYHGRIEVWAVTQKHRRVSARKLFP